MSQEHASMSVSPHTWLPWANPKVPVAQGYIGLESSSLSLLWLPICSVTKASTKLSCSDSWTQGCPRPQKPLNKPPGCGQYPLPSSFLSSLLPWSLGKCCQLPFPSLSDQSRAEICSWKTKTMEMASLPIHFPQAIVQMVSDSCWESPRKGREVLNSHWDVRMMDSIWAMVGIPAEHLSYAYFMFVFYTQHNYNFSLLLRACRVSERNLKEKLLLLHFCQSEACNLFIPAWVSTRWKGTTC